MDKRTNPFERSDIDHVPVNISQAFADFDQSENPTDYSSVLNSQFSMHSRSFDQSGYHTPPTTKPRTLLEEAAMMSNALSIPEPTDRTDKTDRTDRIDRIKSHNQAALTIADLDSSPRSKKRNLLAISKTDKLTDDTFTISQSSAENVFIKSRTTDSLSTSILKKPALSNTISISDSKKVLFNIPLPDSKSSKPLTIDSIDDIYNQAYISQSPDPHSTQPSDCSYKMHRTHSKCPTCTCKPPLHPSPPEKENELRTISMLSFHTTLKSGGSLKYLSKLDSDGMLSSRPNMESPTPKLTEPVFRHHSSSSYVPLYLRPEYSPSRIFRERLKKFEFNTKQTYKNSDAPVMFLVPKEMKLYRGHL